MDQQSFVENTQGRHVDDFYRTPAPVTMALCDELKLRGIEPKTILDVGCGDGAIGRVLRETWRQSAIIGVEPNAERATAAESLRHKLGRFHVYTHVRQCDFVPDRATVNGEAPWLIISNPPFRHALPFLKLATQRVRSGGHVAFLLISQYDQETVHDDERGRFLDSLRHSDGSEGYGQLKFKGRIDFRGNGKEDRVCYKWLVIGPGFEGSFIRIPRSPMGGAEQLAIGGIA